VNRKIAAGGGRLHRLIQDGKTDVEDP